MRPREFIAGLGSAAAWPVMARAQRPQPMRRVGILWPYTETDPDSQSRITSLQRALQDLGWTEGTNIRFDYRWGASAEDRDRIRRYAMELVALAPDVIVAGSGGIAVELKQTSHTVPIVFPAADDPVGNGLVESLAHPGGNATGFALNERSAAGKCVELLKQIAPHVTRVAVIRNPTRGGGTPTSRKSHRRARHAQGRAFQKPRCLPGKTHSMGSSSASSIMTSLIASETSLRPNQPSSRSSQRAASLGSFANRLSICRPIRLANSSRWSRSMSNSPAQCSNCASVSSCGKSAGAGDATGLAAGL
jgi:ABC transporter substrate binding protein